jgi:hypothetical protein
MSPVLQPAPEPARRAYQYAVATASGDGGGTRSSAGPFEIELSNNDRLKKALHKLVLVLPLTILIFEQALLHPDEKIKLPLVELELKINDVMPLFLMLISFMLYRALRYARIVLWTIAHMPRQMNTAGQIVLDDTDAYKMNSAYYEEVLDPAAAALVALWAKLKQGGWVRKLSWSAWQGFNVLKSLIAYGFIFLLLGFMALYVSKEFLSFLASKHIRLFDLHWPVNPTAAIDVLILGVSALLLLMAWSNAATTILMVFWTVLRIIAKALRWISRLLFRLLYSLATWLREWDRDKKFAAETAAYNKQMEDFIATKPDAAEFRIRLKLFDAAWALIVRWIIASLYLGDKILQGSREGESDGTSEWAKVERDYALTKFWDCSYYLKVLALKAPIEIVSSDAWNLQEKLQEIVRSYSAPPPDDALLALLQRALWADAKKVRLLSEAERQKAVVAVRKRLGTIKPKWDDIDSIESDLAWKFTALNTKQHVHAFTTEAEKYFNPWDQEFHRAAPPVRGLRESPRITAFLAFLQRAAGLPSSC